MSDEIVVEVPVSEKRKKQKSKANSNVDPVLKELQSIRRLLCVLLMKNGTSQGELAAALQIDQGALSRELPARKFKLERHV
jgi:DNA-binding MarR family transcriptional regulator